MQYLCRKCGFIGAHPEKAKPPLCHLCNYKVVMTNEAYEPGTLLRWTRKEDAGMVVRVLEHIIGNAKMTVIILKTGRDGPYKDGTDVGSVERVIVGGWGPINGIERAVKRLK